VDVTLVQNTEHDVDHGDGDDEQHPQVSEGTLKGLGRALELRAIVAGSSRSASAWMRLTTSPSEAPGWRLKEMVAEGSWP